MDSFHETKLKKWFTHRKLSTATGAAAFMSTAALTLSPAAVATAASNARIEGNPLTVNSQTVDTKKSQLPTNDKANQIVLGKSLNQTNLTFQKEIEEAKRMLETILSKSKNDFKKAQYSPNNLLKQKALIQYLKVSTLATSQYNVVTELALTNYEQTVDTSYPLFVVQNDINKDVVDEYKKSVYLAGATRHTAIIAAYTEFSTAFYSDNEKFMFDDENVSNVSLNNPEYLKYKKVVDTRIKKFELLRKNARSNYYETIQIARYKIGISN